MQVSCDITIRCVFLGTFWLVLKGNKDASGQMSIWTQGAADVATEPIFTPCRQDNLPAACGGAERFGAELGDGSVTVTKGNSFLV